MKTQSKELVAVYNVDEPMDVHSDEIVYSEHQEEYILKDETLENISPGHGFIHRVHEDDFPYVDSRDLRYYIDDVLWSELMNEYVHRDDVTMTYCESVVSDKWLEDGDDFVYVEHGCGDGYWVDRDYVSYCEDIGDYVHEDEAHWCESRECYYWDEDNVVQENGGRDHLSEYHKGPQPDDKSMNAQFRVGFEIEKTTINGYGVNDTGEEIGEYDFFAKYETDSSCGVEAITHILPLSPVRSKKRKMVFDWIDDAECIINDECDSDCGGHITISAALSPALAKRKLFMNPENLLEKMRGNLSIVYALWRYRLNNTHCQHNKKMDLPHPPHYSTVVVKRSINAVEVRLPNRVQNTKQLKLRYDLMYQIVNASVGKNAAPFGILIKRIKPILMKMYGDKTKVKKIIDLACAFRTYLITDEVKPIIEEFINPSNDR